MATEIVLSVISTKEGQAFGTSSKEPLYVVTFGWDVDTSPKPWPITWLALCYRPREDKPVPYDVGSKWKLTVSEEGELSLVKLK